MTVAELIEQLMEMPPNVQVYSQHPDKINALELVTEAKFEPNLVEAASKYLTMLKEGVVLS